jgi:prophage tail gpP-like protein
MSDDAPDLTISVNGMDVSGWQSIEVTLRAEGFPNSFAIGMSAKDPIPELARAGAECTIALGSDKVITGYIDRDRPGGSANAHSIELVGRGKTQDLVDCSAEWPTGVLIGGTALTIAQTVAKPYGITVQLGEGAEAGPKVPEWNLNFGETGAEIIQRVARNAGLLPIEASDGTLILAKEGTRRAASGAVYGENVQDWSVENSMDGRYSETVCWAISSDIFMDVKGGVEYFAKGGDPGVPRHRVRYTVAELVASDPREFAQLKLNWDVARAAGRGAAVTVTVDSWRDSAGALWAPNTIVPVDVPGNRAGAELLLAEVTFRKDNESGTTARLTLMPQGAFSPEPIVLQPTNTADVVGPGR